MSGSLTQFGIGKETVYGTAVNVDKFYEIISEDIRGSYPRTQAEALSAALVDRADRFAVQNKGASGSVSIEPLSKGFGHWLTYMMGSVVTTGPAETAAYTHASTVANLAGKSLTVQVGRADEGGVVRPWTYEGGKVTQFEISNSVDQTLRVTLSMDFERESNPDSPSAAYALQSNVIVADAEVFTWQGGYIEIGGQEIEAAEMSFTVDNALNTDRYFINQSQVKKEPVQDGKRMIDWSFRTPYVNNNYWERVSSATAAGAYAQLVGRWEGLVAIPGTTTPIYPKLEVRIPVARFDEGGPVVEGPSMLEQTFTGKGLFDGTNSAIQIDYVSADATVLPN